MQVDENGFAEVNTIIDKGISVSKDDAIKIAKKAKNVIDTDSRLPFLQREIRNLADGWKHIYWAIRDELPSQNHALVAVLTHRNESKSAMVLVGQNRNINVSTISFAAQWIDQHDNQEVTQYFVVDLSE